MTLATIACWIFSYLSGSLPFAVWVTRWFKKVDVRDGGSGHMTTTNTIRQAGWVPGILVFILDTAKGFIPIYAATRLGLSDPAIAVAATLAVMGHCWPVLAQFRGGKGLAVTGGALLAVSPLALAVAVGVLLFFVLITRHAARGSFVAALVFPVVLWLLGMRGLVTWITAPVGLLLAARYIVDLKRKYRELWLDREKQT